MNYQIGLKQAKLLFLFSHYQQQLNVFFLCYINNSFKENQARALDDYIETSIMMHLTGFSYIYIILIYSYYN